MRVLLTGLPIPSHLLPTLVPVALALRHAGHEAAIATGRAVAVEVERHGVPVLVLPDVLAPHEVRPSDLPGFSVEKMLAWRPEVDGPLSVPLFIGAMTSAFAANLLEVAAGWRPDVIVRETNEYGGYLAAEVLGVPLAVVDVAPLSVRLMPGLTEGLNELREGFGLPAVSSFTHASGRLAAGLLPERWYPDELRTPGHRFYRAPDTDGGAGGGEVGGAGGTGGFDEGGEGGRAGRVDGAGEVGGARSASGAGGTGDASGVAGGGEVSGAGNASRVGEAGDASGFDEGGEGGGAGRAGDTSGVTGGGEVSGAGNASRVAGSGEVSGARSASRVDGAGGASGVGDADEAGSAGIASPAGSGGMASGTSSAGSSPASPANWAGPAGGAGPTGRAVPAGVVGPAGGVGAGLSEPVEQLIPAQPADGPLVLATFGSNVHTLLSTGSQLMHITVSALGSLPVRAIVALGSVQAVDSWRGARPANVRLAAFVPQRRLLSIADLFVTHAGYSSVREALAVGVPMVALPLFSEQPANAVRVAELGVGLYVETAGVGQDALADGVWRVLGEPAYRVAARGFQRDIGALPALTSFVDDLVTLR